jgi:putative DNA primase/helicase
MNPTEAPEPSDPRTAPVASASRPVRRPRLDPGGFPDQPASGSTRLPQTIDNLAHLLTASGITLSFDVIKKRLDARQDGQTITITAIASLATQYNLCSGWFMPFIQELAERRPINRVRDWIKSKPWDGIDRLPEIYATVHTAEDYPAQLKETLLRCWLLSAVAAATLEGKRFSSPGVLTLQGPQGIGKTSWITSLMPPGALRDDVIKRDHHMDGGNKDSILGAISHWIVEIGELDGALRKDMARLKGFLTNDCDKVRPPYGKVAVEYDRRTVFAATVNEATFLVDQTGNRRFWTIAVEGLDFHHTVDMQQLFAQLLVKLGEGAQWWLTMAEEQCLADYNRRHRAVSAIVGRIEEYVDLERIGEDCGTYMTAIELLRAIGINQPSNLQCKECGSFLRELLGPPKRVHGRDKWRVPVNDRRPTVNLPNEVF